MDEKQKVNQVSRQEKMWAMLCHLGAFSGFIIPFGHIIAPLVIWLIKKEGSPLVDDQGKESLNFQISMTIYYLVAGILTLILIGFVLLIGLVIFSIIMVIMASVKANDGEKFRYPLRIKFIK
ncbi:DUF4870 domain-containing protein [candidate division NPL-UPA2 bacterium]|nr:DUF4870 domain-containing protein [candidate division NPL-UPA2 bacterium]